MQPDNPTHLAPEQILQAACGRLDGQHLLAHADECAVCGKEVESWKTWLGEWNLLGADSGLPAAGPGCLRVEDIVGIAMGAAVGNDEARLAHAASCGRCGALLRSAMSRDEMETGEAELLAALETATPEWQHRLAERVSMPVLRSRARAWQWVGIAAGVMLSAGMSAWWLANRASEPERLLARAYTEARPFEYRLPDAGYGPVRQQRSAAGSSFDRPAALVDAESRIQRSLSGGQESAANLDLKGRAQLLENDSEGAIASLTRSVELQPENAAALADLGCAYAMRADAEQRNLDYGHAIEMFARSLRIDSTQARVLFNQALVYQKMSMVEEAIAAWDRFLKAGPNGDWAAEAKRRRAELEQLRQHKKALMELKKDPASFLALERSTPAALEPELYLDEFWAKWLAAVRSDGVSRAAGEELGRIFAERFHDQSVQDAVKEALAVDAGGELRELGQVVTASVQESNDAAIERGRRLIPALASRRQSTARFRAMLELGYNYTRIVEPQPCLELLDAALHELKPTSYIWLRGQIHLQRAACRARAGDVSGASAEVHALDSAAGAAGLRYQRLRASLTAGALDLAAGNLASVWSMAPEGLKVYWTSGASAFREQQVVHDLAATAETLGWNECAVLMQEATVRATAAATTGSKNKILEALNHSILSGFLERAGHRDRALAEMNMTDQLLNAAEPGPTLESSRLDAVLERAALEATGQDAARALVALTELSRTRPATAGAQERIRILQSLGLAQRAAGHSSDAAESFRSAIRLHEENFRGLSRLQRLAATAAVRDSYCNLAEMELVGGKDVDGSLATWERYRNQLDGGGSGGTPVPSPAPGTVALVFGVFPSGVAVWLKTGSEVRGRMIPASVSLAAIAQSFVRMAAAPDSDRNSLAAEAGKLRSWLIGDYEAAIAPGERLCIEADDWLGAIPFGALWSDKGGYLAEEHPITMTTSLRGSVADSEAGVVAARESGLVVSVAAPLAPGGRRLPVLETARDEAEELRARMPRAVVLMDSAATPKAVLTGIESASIFHFAGHGWANGGNGALLVGGQADGGQISGQAEWIDAEQLSKCDWKKCRLAVLSACLTAAGEERGPVSNRSLVRAFLAAGAKRVVAAHWSVDAAATKALMQKFYDGLFAGARPAEALASAERSVAATRGWSHPYYWAGFDVFGSQ